MKKLIGTVLPTKQSLAITDTWYKQEQARKTEIGTKHFGFAPVFDGFELRWNLGGGRYGIVGRKMNVIIFKEQDETKASNDYV